MDSIALGVAKNQMCLSDFHFLLVEESHRVSCVMILSQDRGGHFPHIGQAVPSEMEVLKFVLIQDLKPGDCLGVGR